MADTWLKLGTSILADAEIRNLSPSAFRGWVLGLAHCAHNLTDGLIEDKALRLIDVKAKERDELICAGLWKPIENVGVEVVNYLRWQRSAEQVRNQREAARARQARKRGGSS